MNRRSFLAGVAATVPAWWFASPAPLQASWRREPPLPPFWRTRIQQAFIESRAPLRALIGGRGAGKSTAGSLDMLTRARPGGVYAAISPTSAMLKGSTLRTLLGVAKELKCPVEQAGNTVTIDNGARILFCRAGDARRLPNLAGCWIDDASYCGSAVLATVEQRLMRDSGWLSATFTANGKNHWTYRTFCSEQHWLRRLFCLTPRVECFVSRTADNPWMPPAFEPHLRAVYGRDVAAQELDCEFLDQGVKVQRRMGV